MGLLDFLFGKKNQNSAKEQLSTNEEAKPTPSSSSKASIKSSDPILESNSFAVSPIHLLTILNK